MRVAFLSHSLVAGRQAAFAAELRRQLVERGGALSELFPARWGQHEREGGWACANQGDMTQYLLPLDAWDALAAWEPSVLLLQQEAYCAISVQAMEWARRHRVPLVTFSWENAMAPPKHAQLVLNAAAVNVFGNTDARRLAAEAGVDAPSVILPQVGIDTALFTPGPLVPPQYDICFNGRPADPMKGLEVLERAVAGQAWSVWRKTPGTPFVPDSALPDRYRACTIQCVPSRDVAGRPREQFAPAVSIEGLLCGVPLVTTDQAAIREWTHTGPYIGDDVCPAAWWVGEGDVESLRSALNQALLEWVNDRVQFRELGLRGRSWAVKHFSNERVAGEYARVLERAVGRGG